MRIDIMLDINGPEGCDAQMAPLLGFIVELNPDLSFTFFENRIKQKWRGSRKEHAVRMSPLMCQALSQTSVIRLETANIACKQMP